MAYQQHTMTSLIVVDPAKARAMIVRAFRKAGASRRRAAAAIGCSEVTLWRWVNRLDMTAQLRAVEEEAERGGWSAGLSRRGSGGKRKAVA